MPGTPRFQTGIDYLFPKPRRGAPSLDLVHGKPHGYAWAGETRIRRSLGTGSFGFIEKVGTPASLPSVNPFEVKIGQIHVAAGQDVDSKNIPPLAEADLEKL